MALERRSLLLVNVHQDVARNAEQSDQQGAERHRAQVVHNQPADGTQNGRAQARLVSETRRLRWSPSYVWEGGMAPYLEKYHLATELAMTMDWQAKMNSLIQMKPTMW